MSANPNVMGIIAQCLAFLVEIQICGLEDLTNPPLPLNTRYRFKIPGDTIDMDFTKRSSSPVATVSVTFSSPPLYTHQIVPLRRPAETFRKISMAIRVCAEAL